MKNVLIIAAVFALATPAAWSGDLATVPLATKAPLIDGDLTDECWSAAMTADLNGFCDNARRMAGVKPTDMTRVRLLCDPEHLYVSFRCAESQQAGPWVYRNAKLAARGNSHVLGGDHASIAIALGRFGFYNYYFFAVNPAGEAYRCFTWPQRYDLILRDIALPEVTAAAKIDADQKGWSAELKIPLKPMLRHPADGMPKIVGLDLRRAAYGPDRNQPDMELYWTGSAAVSGTKVKPYYDHLATWTPLFETYPAGSAYAAGRGWIQLVFPESFGHVQLACGTLENKLISGAGAKLEGLIDTRMGWDSTAADHARIARMFDTARMEYWDDLRTTDRPKNAPVVVRTQVLSAREKPAGFAALPQVTVTPKETRIAFSVSSPTDATIAVIDGNGRIVRHLASGVLGPNAPQPFVKNQLTQTLVWDHTDDLGRPIPPGSYQVVVSLGLQAAFDHAIPIENNWWSKDPTPTAEGLDIDHMPNPTLGKTLGHFSMGGRNYLAVDREREELYIQTNQIYDGRTGKKLRDLKLGGPPISVASGVPRTGELAVSRNDGMIYMTGPNEVWRFDREGQPAPFAAVGRHFVPELWGDHGNPHRGIAVGMDGAIYKVHHYVPHASPKNQISRLAPDGRIAAYGFIEINTSVAGLRADREGNVYVGCTVQPADDVPPTDVTNGMPDKTRTLFKRLYGSIVKFSPKGGTIQPDANGKLVCPGPKGLLPYRVEGAEWIHPGYSPMLSRVPDAAGGPGCSCRNARFDLDDYARLFIPDGVGGRIEVTDSNANTILLAGQRGKPDATGAEFGWGTQVAVSDEAIYVADYLRYRVVRLKLTYAKSASAAAVVGQ